MQKGQDISPLITEDAPHGSTQGERKMEWFIRLWAWLFKDKRSDWEQKQERRFIMAVNQLKNYSVSDRGGLSMDPEELRERVMASREKLKHLVQPSASNHTTHVHQFTTAHLTGHQGGSSPSATGVSDFLEVVTWRRLTSGASVRYVCLEALTTKLYCVALADYFSSPGERHSSLDTMATDRVAKAIAAAELKWFDSLGEAMNAFDASI